MPFYFSFQNLSKILSVRIPRQNYPCQGYLLTKSVILVAVDSLIVGVGTLEVVAVVVGLTSVIGVFKICKKSSFGALPLQQ